VSRAKELLEQATPLPWVVQEPGPNDPGAGTVFIDTHAFEWGPEPVIADSAPLGREDALLIAYAVNRLPDYEAAVEILAALMVLPGYHAEDCYIHAPDLTTCECGVQQGRIAAKAALARLRDEVPA